MEYNFQDLILVTIRVEQGSYWEYRAYVKSDPIVSVWRAREESALEALQELICKNEDFSKENICSMKVPDFITQVCNLQGDNCPAAYVQYALAYAYVKEHWCADNYHILRLAYILGRRGFRKTSVILPNCKLGLAWELVPQAMENLWENVSRLSPSEIYEEFEIIHPFEDCNGRIGALLYNLYNISLDNPILPPEPDWDK